MAARSNLSALDTSAFTIQPVSIDDDGVLQRVLAEVDESLGAPTAQINVDLQTAADAVIRVIAGLRGDGGLYGRYKVLAAVGETDFAALARLNRHAPAMWFAAYRYKLEREAPGRVLTEDALAGYNDLRDRLHFVLSYHFGDDAKEGPRLRAVSRSRDHLVLANNLRYLAELAVERTDDLAHDRKLDPHDVQRALAGSTEIRLALGAKEVPDVRWLDRAAVLWTLVQRDYAELANIGRFLLRGRPEEARRRFPSLVRSGGRRSDDVVEAPDDEAKGEAEEGDAPANDAAKAEAPATPAETAAKPAVVKATEPATKPRSAKRARRR
jgi:hypothetical protein